ncbi:MAG: hypothetical protein SFV15_21415 [Polyangiaceae bacterium]|nr:hypothetical protein [Polyangiaceae bacterium]
MRTTLTLDPDVAKGVAEEVHRQRSSMKQVVNDALRRGLATAKPRTPKRFRIVPHRTALQPGIDTGRLNALADELEEDATLKKFGA